MKSLSLLLASSAVLALAGCSSTTSNPAATQSTTSTGAANIYATNVAGSSGTLDGQIVAFPAASTGAATPSSTLNDASNTSFGFLASDTSGNIYATTAAVYSSAAQVIQVYSESSTGALSLSRSFTCTCFSGQGNITVDKSGTVYADMGNKTYAFSSTATGTATPTFTLSDYGGWMTTDANGDLYLQNGVGTTIYFFAAPISSTSTPSRTIALASAVTQINSLAVDTSGNLYVLASVSGGTPEILVYSATASDSAVPTRTITGSATTMVQPSTIAVDAAGTIYVDDFTASAPLEGFILKFSSTANGNSAPASSFTAASITYGGGGIAVGTPTASVTVSPGTANLTSAATQQFTATVSDMTNTAVTWSVNSIAGGNSSVGTISTNGLYTAPAVQSSSTATIEATSQAEPSVSGSATVTLSTTSSSSCLSGTWDGTYSDTFGEYGTLTATFTQSGSTFGGGITIDGNPNSTSPGTFSSQITGTVSSGSGVVDVTFGPLFFGDEQDTGMGTVSAACTSSNGNFVTPGGVNVGTYTITKQ